MTSTACTTARHSPDTECRHRSHQSMTLVITDITHHHHTTLTLLDRRTGRIHLPTPSARTVLIALDRSMEDKEERVPALHQKWPGLPESTDIRLCPTRSLDLAIHLTQAAAILGHTSGLWATSLSFAWLSRWTHEDGHITQMFLHTTQGLEDRLTGRVTRCSIKDSAITDEDTTTGTSTCTRHQGDVKLALPWRRTDSQHGIKEWTFTTQVFTIALPGPIVRHHHLGLCGIPGTLLTELLRKLKTSVVHIRCSFSRTVK